MSDVNAHIPGSVLPMIDPAEALDQQRVCAERAAEIIHAWNRATRAQLEFRPWEECPMCGKSFYNLPKHLAWHAGGAR